MDLLKQLRQTKEKERFPPKVWENFSQLYETYAQSIHAAGMDMKKYDHIFTTLFQLVREQLDKPFQFEPFHKRVTTPFNYYQFGLTFMRPLVDKSKTKIFHLERVEEMVKQIKAKENVILFANHQTEVDPQLMNVALEESYPDFAEELIFVAGDRVITDPMAIPFSMGCNLLCIYSKRHIDNPPEKKHEKQLHNQRTMRRMKELLSEGGKCIYVAPSGGRDRPDEKGDVDVAPFDPQSIEMYRFMVGQAERPTHFYPLALDTYDILPPPQGIEHELGEDRKINREGAYFSFGEEIDMETIADGEGIEDRHAKRSARAHYIWHLVKNEYTFIKKEGQK